MDPKTYGDARPRAKLTGAVYLLYFVAAAIGGLFMKGLLVPTDAAATANNILAHELLYRVGLAFDLLGNAIYIALTVLLYSLLRRIDRSLALFMALVSVAGCTVQLVGGVFRLVPLFVLGPGHAFGAFTPDQLQATALLALTLFAHSYTVSFALFGLFDISLGCLIYRSNFLPRFIGAWFILGGIGALVFLWPPLAKPLQYVILPVAGLAEVALMLWLLLRGVDEGRWRERTRGTDHSILPGL